MTIVVDIVDLINNSMRNLRESEQQVAAMVLADQQFVITASTTELAKRANVSATSITRFCRALGFKGLREFKLCVAQNLAINARFMADSTAHTDSFSELVATLTRALSTSLSDMSADLSMEDFATALDIISAARHVSVLPTDHGSHGVALDAYTRLLRLGVEASVHFSADEQRMTAGVARRSNALVILAADPATQELAELVEIVNEQSVPAVLIAPLLPGLHVPSGVHIAIRNSRPAEVFAQAALRYKQAIVIDLLCTGHSLNLSDGLRERQRPIQSQTAPPLKQERN